MDYFESIYSRVREIPSGKVASYGEVAKAAGLFRGARVVGWALKALPATSDVPWQRVINQKAQISIVNPRIPQSLQKELLEKEGVEVQLQEGCFKVINPPWYRFQNGQLSALPPLS